MRPSKIPTTSSWISSCRRFAACSASIFLLGLWFPRPSFTAPFVKSGEIIVSVDDVADVWINGVPVMQSQKITMKDRGGPATQKVDPCLFQPDNVIALRDTDNNPSMVMIAFLLKAKLSDGTTLFFSSRDSQGIKSFYVGNPRSPEPGAWWLSVFDDRDWKPPMGLGPFSSYLALIGDSDEKLKPIYLSATDQSGKTLVDGERHLFRGSFRWDIDANPACVSPTPTRESIHSTAPMIPMQPAVILIPSPTFTARPFTFPPTSAFVPPSPTATPPPLPTATRWISKPTATKPPIPTATPWRPKPTPIRPLNPTPTTPWKKFEPTPTIRYNGDVMVTGPRRWLPSTPTFTPSPALPKAASIPTPAPHPEAMVFDQLPVAIRVKLADGAGDYTVDLYSEQGAFLKRVFDEKVPGDLEDWVEWDGKLGGRWAPSGTYLFVCRKETWELKRIWIVLKTKP